ncbi:MAG: DUF6250 domain-containing protein [bacterium]|nr:DUF6250 domain-containing protein [bacterium]
MPKYKTTIMLTCLILGSALAQCESSSDWQIDSLLFEENFDSGDLGNWVLELENPATSTVEIKNGVMDIDVDGGATIWFKPLLEGNVMIEYEITVVDSGGSNDRISDLNQFWMASDPGNPDLFTRSGRFPTYHGLLLYYVGMGGNNNSTTRFRKYPGDGSRDLLYEHTDKAHLLTANTPYKIQIVTFDTVTQFIVNDEIYFHHHDADLIPAGHFGIRTVRNHETIDNFKVYRLVD